MSKICQSAPDWHITVRTKSIGLLLLSFLLLQCTTKTKPGSNEFVNPLYIADYPDPDVVRAGDAFYMVTSSFPYSPGLPIYRSFDLVHWEQIGNAFEQQHSDHYDIPRHGDGVYAPSIKEHDGTYYIYYGDPDFGIVMLKADDPAGPWSEPKIIAEAKGWIDPTPFWDEDGSAYLIHAYAKSRAGINSLLVLHRMSPDGESLLDDGTIIYDGTIDNPIIEGPKFYKRNGYYYIFAPAGSVPYGWETVLRSRSIYGPYEVRKVYHQGYSSINGPHQGSWISLDSGEDWFLHFQDYGTYGRIPHLNPLTWTDEDWPVIGVDPDGDGVGEPVMRSPYPNIGEKPGKVVAQRTSDDFSSSTLSPQWRWHGNYESDWFSLDEREGFLRLKSVSTGSSDINLVAIPHFVSQRFPDEEFTVTAKIDLSGLEPGEEMGLGVSGETYGVMTATPSEDDSRLEISFKTRYQARNSGIGQTLTTKYVDSDLVYLRLEVEKEALCTFSYSLDGKTFHVMGRDFKASKLRWVGASFGFYSASTSETGSGYSDIDWVRVSYTPQNQL